VNSKSSALVQFLSQLGGAQRTYALLTLAAKMISQCEAQVGGVCVCVCVCVCTCVC
jgi:hypothetical protein